MFKMSSLFPAANSPQRHSAQAATKRSKVSLQPGHSLMDWIRLTKSGVDLRGTGPRLLEVTLEELNKHNKPEDSWIALKGYVYNVTRYCNYHPGGQAELMKGAGKDATNIFNKVHRWVNFESMLQACLVGRLVENTSFSSKKQLSLPPHSNTLSLNLASDLATSSTQLLVNVSDSNTEVSDKVIMTWNQSNTDVHVTWSMNGTSLSKYDLVCNIHDAGRLFQGEIYLENEVLMIGLELKEQVKKEISVTHNSLNNSIMVTLEKFAADKKWSILGSAMQSHCQSIPRSLHNHRYYLSHLISKTAITHDTCLYHFKLPDSCYMCVPVGYHVYLQADIGEICISRPYTIVVPDLCNVNSELLLDGRNLFMMIKAYNDGAFTSNVKNLREGDTLSISTYEGTFSISMLSLYQNVLMLCGGTGFTPMIRILHYCLHKSKKTVQLAFYNKTVEDILWMDKLSTLCMQFSGRFSIRHVLSQPGKEWNGEKGRIALAHLQDMLNACQDNVLVLVCGPMPFTEQALRYLSELGVNSNSIFTFT
ncbi:unnamed protein product [Clavelina lepadiformis]|uniref:Cytochrome-b5 reductase n=2 Tax=Clavelina lepadiformis TaxID=159417 RepID=A0ABP0GE95_CLALP